VTEDDLVAGRATPGFRALDGPPGGRARVVLRRRERLLPLLDRRSRMCVRTLAGSIGNPSGRSRRATHDVFAARVASAPAKLRLMVTRTDGALACDRSPRAWSCAAARPRRHRRRLRGGGARRRGDPVEAPADPPRPSPRAPPSAFTAIPRRGAGTSDNAAAMFSSLLPGLSGLLASARHDRHTPAPAPPRSPRPVRDRRHGASCAQSPLPAAAAPGPSFAAIRC